MTGARDHSPASSRGFAGAFATPRTVLLALALIPSLACMPAMMAWHAASPAPAMARAAPGAEAVPVGACPMIVAGTQVAASDAPAGEALTFTTASGDVGEVRRRAHAMAEGHDHGAAGAGHGGMGHGAGMMGAGMMGHGMMGTGGGQARVGQGPGGGHGVHEAAIPPSRMAVEDVDGGARIVVTPDDPADLETVRSAVRARARHMQQHGCQVTGA